MVNCLTVPTSWIQGLRRRSRTNNMKLDQEIGDTVFAKVQVHPELTLQRINAALSVGLPNKLAICISSLRKLHDRDVAVRLE